jgi:hypothetical protein
MNRQDSTRILKTKFIFQGSSGALFCIHPLELCASDQPFFGAWGDNMLIDLLFSFGLYRRGTSKLV